VATWTILPDLGAEVEITGTYWPGSPDHFDKGYGNWVPGDPPEVELKSIRLDPEGTPVDEDSITERDRLAAEDAVCVAAYEDEE
jgi:hypothetical protein